MHFLLYVKCDTWSKIVRQQQAQHQDFSLSKLTYSNVDITFKDMFQANIPIYKTLPRILIELI